MRRAVASPVALGATEVTPKISAGAAIAGDGDDADALLHRADEAMYVAKRAHAAVA